MTRRFTISSFAAIATEEPPVIPHKGLLVIDEMSGWDSSPGINRSKLKRPWSPGDFAVPGTKQSRPISMSGWGAAGSTTALNELRRRTVGLLAGGGFAPFKETGEFGSWEAPEVGVDGEILFDIYGTGRVDATWLMTLYSPKPQKYGRPRHFTGSTPVWHRGNFSAVPRLTASIPAGSRDGYTITGPDGLALVVIETLVAGQPHVIDQREGVLRINGDRIPGAMTRADRWAIPPDTRVVHTISPGLNLDIDLVDTDV